jgi:hypothetical protein
VKTVFVHPHFVASAFARRAHHSSFRGAPTSPRKARPDDRLREAIHIAAEGWIASLNARNDGGLIECPDAVNLPSG